MAFFFRGCTMMINPVALVTGGSRGIGRGICQELNRIGYRIIVNYAGNREAAEETQRALSHPEQSILVQADVGSDYDRRRLVDESITRLGRIDVLVNNAGITSVGRKDILEATEESWDKVIATNLKGPFFLSQLISNLMIQRKDLIRPCIINISSLSATVASVNRADYCITKAGMVMMTQLYALRLAEHGIRVFEVRPGVIETEMTAVAREKYLQKISDGMLPIPRLGQPSDVGKVVAWLAGNETPYMTGEVLNVDGGFHLRKL
jgi:3-oxoacyl-[acyl-carrier protein] reductase